MTVLLFGYGFLGRAVGREARRLGLEFAAIIRNPDVAAIVASDGGAAVPLDDQAMVTRAVQKATAILITPPPGEAGCPGLIALEPLLTRSNRWIGYLSTTGVYGDLKGGWAFEETPLAPISDEGRRRAQVEAAWAKTAKTVGASLAQFRLPGLYGPGRSAFDRLRDGTARRVYRPGQLFSRLHIDDGARAIVAAMKAKAAGAFNLCDDEPAPNADVIAFAAKLADLACPPIEDYSSATMTSAGRRFYAESKRVSNAKAKATLGWRPHFPTYREGLAAILAGEG